MHSQTTEFNIYLFVYEFVSLLRIHIRSDMISNGYAISIRMQKKALYQKQRVVGLPANITSGSMIYTYICLTKPIVGNKYYMRASSGGYENI